MANYCASDEINKITRANDAISKRLMNAKLSLNSIRQFLNQESTNTKELHKREYYDRMLQQKIKKNEEEKETQELKAKGQLSKVDLEIENIKQQIELFVERKEKEIELLKHKKELIEEKCEKKCENLENDFTIQNYIREIQMCDEKLAKERPKKQSEIKLENEIKMLEAEMKKNNDRVTETIKNIDDLKAQEASWKREQQEREEEYRLKEAERERIEKQIYNQTIKCCTNCRQFIYGSKAPDICVKCETPKPAPEPVPEPVETPQNILIAMEHKSVSEITDVSESIEEYTKRKREENEELLRRIELMRNDDFEEVKKREEAERIMKEQARERLDAKRKELLTQADNEPDSKKRYSLKYEARNLKIADFY